MESSIPYIVLGVLYVYLLYLSWTTETLKYMFSSKYMLPEVLHSFNHPKQECINAVSNVFFFHLQLSGIAKMFSSEMTLASAWIHLLVVDLFAARYIAVLFLLN